jgi:hypothetical protein
VGRVGHDVPEGLLRLLAAARARTRTVSAFVPPQDTPRPYAERPARTQQVRHFPCEGVSRNTRPLKIPTRARHTTHDHDHVSQFLGVRRLDRRADSCHGTSLPIGVSSDARSALSQMVSCERPTGNSPCRCPKSCSQLEVLVTVLSPAPMDVRVEALPIGAPSVWLGYTPTRRTERPSTAQTTWSASRGPG